MLVAMTKARYRLKWMNSNKVNQIVAHTWEKTEGIYEISESDNPK